MSNDDLLSRVNDLLKYDPTSGQFTWKISRGTVKAGALAGSDNGQGYIDISIDGRSYKAHLLALLVTTGEMPRRTVDHINGVRSDNRIENLRVAGQSANMRNARRYRNNRSGVTGVYWSQCKNRWIASSFTPDGKKQHATFKTLLDASAWRKGREIEHGYHSNHGRAAMAAKEA